MGMNIDRNLDLGVIGMPGCELYASLDVLVTVPLPGPLTTFPLAIPNVPALAGSLLFGQSAAFVPTANPLGIATSNGVKLTLGV